MWKQFHEGNFIKYISNINQWNLMEYYFFDISLKYFRRQLLWLPARKMFLEKLFHGNLKWFSKASNQWPLVMVNNRKDWRIPSQRATNDELIAYIEFFFSFTNLIIHSF